MATLRKKGLYLGITCTHSWSHNGYCRFFYNGKTQFLKAWKLAGMFEGIYAGGTPNFVAIKMALNVDANYC